MTGKVRRILLFLLTLVVLAAVACALYFLRGLDGLPLIGGKDTASVVIETPEPAETEQPEAGPDDAEETAVPDAAEPPDTESPQAEENVSSTLSGTLHTAAGDVRYKSEILGPDGEEEGSISIGNVYVRTGKVRVRFFEADGSALADPVELEYSSENLHQEARSLDLNGDGSDELILRVYTFEDEHAVLLFTFDPETGVYGQAAFAQPGVLVWGSDFDAASGCFWYRHGSPVVTYDCYELQGTSLTISRRLEDDRQSSEEERFTEYEVVGDRLLIVNEKVPASKIDQSKWSFVNF